MFPSVLHAATATSRPHTPRGQWSFRPRLLHSNPCKKVPLRPVLVHLNLKSCIVTAMLLHPFCQWEGVKVFQTRCLTFLGRLLVWPRLGESEFYRPICQVWFNIVHPFSFWIILICKGWIRTVKTISCNQGARLPNVTDRMLPSSPSCQLQGMLWVNLCCRALVRVLRSILFLRNEVRQTGLRLHTVFWYFRGQ